MYCKFCTYVVCSMSESTWWFLLRLTSGFDSLLRLQLLLSTPVLLLTVGCTPIFGSFTYNHSRESDHDYSWTTMYFGFFDTALYGIFNRMWISIQFSNTSSEAQTSTWTSAAKTWSSTKCCWNFHNSFFSVNFRNNNDNNSDNDNNNNCYNYNTFKHCF